MSIGKRPYFEIANQEICGILKSLPRGLQVLDVGCADKSIVKARTRLAEAHIGDVTKPEPYPFANTKKFDVIVFSDILEHLYDPAAILRIVPCRVSAGMAQGTSKP